MKSRTITLVAIIFTLFGSPSFSQQTCEQMINDKLVILKQIKEEEQNKLTELSSARSCASAFDELQNANQKVNVQIENLDTRTEKISSLKSDIKNILAALQENAKNSKVPNGDMDLSGLLAERLAYREQIKQWELRDSADVQEITTELITIENEIEKLEDQIDKVANWQDRTQFAQLQDTENEIKKNLTQLQIRLSALQKERTNPDLEAAFQLQKDGPLRVSALKDSLEGLLDQIAVLEIETSEQTSYLKDTNAQISDLDREVSEIANKYEALKQEQSKSTQSLASIQLDKNRLLPILQSLTTEELTLNSNLERLTPQAQATQEIVNQLQDRALEKTEVITELDRQITAKIDHVKSLKDRVNLANQSITVIRGDMDASYKPLNDFQNVENQVFALKLTIEGLDKEINNLDTRVSGAEAKLNRFIRACKREPACKSALNL